MKTLEELQELVAEIRQLLPSTVLGAAHRHLRSCTVTCRTLSDGSLGLLVITPSGNFTVELEDGDTAQELANVIVATADGLGCAVVEEGTEHESRIAKLEKEVAELKSRTRLYR